MLLYCTVLLACICSILSHQVIDRETRLKDAASHLSQIIQAREILHRRNRKVKLNTPMQKAFDDIDADVDGHITAEEFAMYYAMHFPILEMSVAELQKAFSLELPEVDTNHNGKLELDEFEVSARRGGHF